MYNPEMGYTKLLFAAPFLFISVAQKEEISLKSSAGVLIGFRCKGETCIWKFKIAIFANFKSMLKNGVFCDLVYSTLLWFLYIHHLCISHFILLFGVGVLYQKRKVKVFFSWTWLHRTKYAQNAYLNFIFKFCERWFGGSLYHIQFITSI